jgi:phosphatidylglycerol---prolipoprotein diacylglyceryl transferase
MIPFPDLSPTLFEIEIGGFTFALRWYALAYIVGLIVGWQMVTRAVRDPALRSGVAPMTAEQVERLLTWVIFGVILGGRAGYVLFYDDTPLLSDPLHILRVWEGGMSFHGGFAGVIVAGLIFCKREGIALLPTADLMAVAAPPGLLLGRLANFVNAELWGRQTDLPWGVIFPGTAAQTCAGVVGVCARHPSQLYEAALEGLVLGAVLIWLGWRRGAFRTPGLVLGVFLAGYGLARVAVEFVRQPDVQFVSDGNPLGLAVQMGGWGLTMGQLLSLPMIIVGLWFLLRARRA